MQELRAVLCHAVSHIRVRPVSYSAVGAGPNPARAAEGCVEVQGLRALLLSPVFKGALRPVLQ